MTKPQAVRSYHIPAGDGLDDIDLIIFDHGPESSRIIIRCRDHAWTAWRGSHSAPSIEDYLIKSNEIGLAQTRMFQPSRGFEATEETWLKKIIKRICEFLIEQKAEVNNQDRFVLMPTELSPVIKSVLGILCFEIGHFAELYRQSGYEIQRKAEEEQAFCLHRFLSMALVHGGGWLTIANEEINLMKKAIAAKEVTP